MAFVLRIVGFARGGVCPVAGAFIQSFDEKEGLIVTDRREDALEFPTSSLAFQFWRQELDQGVQGENPFGPNRPLTAFTVTIYDPDREDQTIWKKDPREEPRSSTR